MNFIENETAQKLRGGYPTHPEIARFLTRWVLEKKPTSLFEPSCGDGVFIRSLLEVKNSPVQRLFACEIDPKVAAVAKGCKPRGNKPAISFHVGDFLKWFLFESAGVPRFQGALGNPPFIRYQYLPEEQQLLAEKIFARFDLPFTKHTNAWVPFVVASLALLEPGGRLGMVVPSEIFHIPHAQSLRRFLADKCSKILILDPTEIWFTDTLQGTVLLMAEKKAHPDERGRGVGVVPVANRQSLTANAEQFFLTANYLNGTTIEGKWMAVFLSDDERALLAKLKAQENVKRFVQLASVDVGIVTGANKFFLVPDSTVEQFRLQKWAYPMFGRSEHVHGLLYTATDHRANKKAGLPANFLWFTEEDETRLPSNVREYLQTGLRQKLETRFKCRVRTPWYKVPSVSTAPIAMLKRAHNFPRLVLNDARAYTTDTAYRIRPTNIKAEAFVFAFVNSLTTLCAEMEGRHYGGGVLELVPSEIERLLVPVVEASRHELAATDAKFRASTDEVAFVQSQDAIVLGRIGLTKEEQTLLHGAWLKLRDRRQRLSAPLVQVEELAN
jgi:adenine-specific DNA methylase